MRHLDLVDYYDREAKSLVRKGLLDESEQILNLWRKDAKLAEQSESRLADCAIEVSSELTAEGHFSRAVAVLDSVRKGPLSESSRASVLHALGVALMRNGQLKLATKALSASTEASERLIDENAQARLPSRQTHVFLSSDLAVTLVTLANIESDLGWYDEARTHAAQAVKVLAAVPSAENIRQAALRISSSVAQRLDQIELRSATKGRRQMGRSDSPPTSSSCKTLKPRILAASATAFLVDRPELNGVELFTVSDSSRDPHSTMTHNMREPPDRLQPSRLILDTELRKNYQQCRDQVAACKMACRNPGSCGHPKISTTAEFFQAIANHSTARELRWN